MIDIEEIKKQGEKYEDKFDIMDIFSLDGRIKYILTFKYGQISINFLSFLKNIAENNKCHLYIKPYAEILIETNK